MTIELTAIEQLFQDKSLRAPDNAIGFVLWRVVHRYQRDVDRALGAIGLTHLQFMTLILAAWLGRKGEEVSQAEIARFGDIHAMQVSLMLKPLEEKGMVVRGRSTVDIRTKRVDVTDVGLQTLGAALPLVIAVQRELFGEDGMQGGALLSTLLQLEREYSED